MPLNAIPLDLDPSGQNPDNLISNEPYSLSSRQTRSIATKMGPFFAKSLVIRDGTRELNRGTDYQVVELHQEATLLYAQEIASIVLIINPAVSSTGTISYQALGGHYASNSAPIANLYETVINDNRPVDWVNVLNKLVEYPPSIHRHLLEDIYGFEPVVDYLERIKSAITLGQTDVLLSIIRELTSGFACKELPKVLPSSKMMAYDSMLYFLSRRKILSNTWIDTLKCTWQKGDSAAFQIDTSAYPVGTPLYWSFYKPHGVVSLFSTKEGVIHGNGGIVTATVYVPTEAIVNNDVLYMGVKLHREDEEYLAVTYKIKVIEDRQTTSAVCFMLHTTAKPTNQDSFVSEFADDPEKRLYYNLRYA